MFEILNKTKEWLLDILLPKFCIGCGREGEYICKDCEIFLSEIENATPGLVSVWEYEGLMKKLIYKIKRHGCYHIIDELIEKALNKMDLNLPEETIITYVPMHKKQEKQRGFNQSEIMARKIGKITGRKVLPLLVKIEDNRPQGDLPPEFRVDNVENVFSFSSSFVPRNVLLVDDYYVTGATANECSKVLKEKGVEGVWIFTLACQLSMLGLPHYYSVV